MLVQAGALRPALLDTRSDEEREAAQKAGHEKQQRRLEFYSLCNKMQDIVRDLPKFAALLPAERMKIESAKHKYQTFDGLRANLKIISKLLGVQS